MQAPSAALCALVSSRLAESRLGVAATGHPEDCAAGDDQQPQAERERTDPVIRRAQNDVRWGHQRLEGNADAGKFEPGIETWDGLPRACVNRSQTAEGRRRADCRGQDQPDEKERAPRPPFAPRGKEMIEHGAHLETDWAAMMGQAVAKVTLHSLRSLRAQASRAWPDLQFRSPWVRRQWEVTHAPQEGNPFGGSSANSDWDDLRPSRTCI